MLIYLTNLNASGLRDWITQRVSAVLLAIYSFILASFLFTHHPLNYHQWHSFFMQPWMQIFTLFILFSLLFHAWIGLWIIGTDYIKPVCIRFFFQFFVIFTLLTCLIVACMIIWGF